MRPLSQDLVFAPKAELLFRKSGQAHYINLGSADALTVEVTVEETEKYANNRGSRVLLKRGINQTDVAVSMTLAQMSAFARAASVMSDEATMSQVAALDATADLQMTVGGIYKLPHLRVSGVTIAGAVEGVDFIVDSDAGFIESITLTGSKTVTYDAAAISTGHASGIANNGGIRGELVIRGTNDDGVRSMVTLWDVELRPASARALISESEFGTVELTGRCYVDSTKPIGFAFGKEETL